MSDSDDVFDESSDSDAKPSRPQKRQNSLTNNTRRYFYVFLYISIGKRQSLINLLVFI